MLEAAKAVNSQQLVGFALAWAIYSALQTGDIIAVKQYIRDYADVAERMREPFFLCLLKGFQACEASLEGRFTDCERLAQEAFAIGHTLEVETAAGVFGAQMFTLRREQGRLREVESLLGHFVRTPEGAHAWRPGLALI